ncbi:MAG: CsbD family protein [Deltaproteobacteria bacterium]|nr:CsbD family protein [Deltaproteobacteria bacterium]
MKSSTKNQVKGTIHQLKGSVKEIAGRLSSDGELEAEGIGERLAGNVQEKIGQVEKLVEK